MTARERGHAGEAALRDHPAGAISPERAGSRLAGLLRAVWSASRFDSEDLAGYAQPVLRAEAQHGIFALGALGLLLMAGLALLYDGLGFDTGYVYTFAMLALLSGHTAASAKLIDDVKVLHLLGMVLLAACGLAFTLLAHRYGAFGAPLFSTVVLLFMLVPLVPWGLREALCASGIVYFIFTASSLSVARTFDRATLWTLQFLMLAGAAIALAVVARAVLVRKAHLEARFGLSGANEELYRLSHRDALTGAWNRRFLEERFGAIVAQHARDRQQSCFGLIDIDKFKQLNDTYGHHCGDLVLQRMVRVMSGALRADDYVVRMGGDEFAMLLRGEQVHERVERALQEFGSGDECCPGLTALPRVSVGLVHLPTSVPASLEAAYLDADRALYAAKEHPSRWIVEVGRQQRA